MSGAGPSSTRDGDDGLERLGVESPKARQAKRIVPWLVSIAIHAALIAIGVTVTWTVMSDDDEDEPALIVADFEEMTFDPLATESDDDAEADDAADAPAEPLTEAWQPTDDVPADPMDWMDAGGEAAADFEPQPGGEGARFLGLSATNARDVVYVIDASGSMIRSLQIVVEELGRSLDRLTTPQRFAIVFFQRNDALVAPPGRLTPATEQARLDALRWIDETVIPAGRSNPLPAMERALSMRPDAVFLLSENITGSGEWEIEQSTLLAELDRMNPADAQTGRRPTQINCVQFLDPDPLETLKIIAERHGGPEGYRFLSRRRLGISVP